MIVVAALVKAAMKNERMHMKGQIIMIGNKSNRENFSLPIISIFQNRHQSSLKPILNDYK